MIKIKKLDIEWLIIVTISIAKIFTHFLTFNNFELHRDAYLYFAQSQHLAWGFVAVPPFISIIGKISTIIFGQTTFGLRFFPTIFGGLNIILIGISVKELGGRWRAILIACAAYLFSPVYLHANALFQPVTFNQFFWLLCSYLILVMIKRNDPKFWIWIGISFGIGFLNKYSIVFLGLSFAISLLISEHRKLYYSKYFLMGIALGLLIIFPNILWQYQHNWPVLMHMQELRETQLVNVQISSFLIDQVMMNFQALLLLLGAIIIIIFKKDEKQFRLFIWMFLGVIIILILGSGKSYYSLGIYPILFAFGGYCIEKYVHKFQNIFLIVLLIHMAFTLYLSLSIDGIPFVDFEKVEKPDAYRWEDGKYYDVPQDMADMVGWKEIGQQVNVLYHQPEIEGNCDIYCEHYAQAGAVMFWGKNIPQPISYNGSFTFWSPDSLTKEYFIWVHRETEDEHNFNPSELFEKAEVKWQVNNHYFRENGTQIYLCKNPTEQTKLDYIRQISEHKNRYKRLKIN